MRRHGLETKTFLFLKKGYISTNPGGLGRDVPPGLYTFLYL